MVRGRDAVVGGGRKTWKSQSKSLPLQPYPTELSETVCKLPGNHDTSRSRAAPQMSQITAGLTRHCARSGWTLVLLCVSVVVTALVGCAVMARVCRTGREENGKGSESAEVWTDFIRKQGRFESKLFSGDMHGCEVIQPYGCTSQRRILHLDDGWKGTLNICSYWSHSGGCLVNHRLSGVIRHGMPDMLLSYPPVNEHVVWLF